MQNELEVTIIQSNLVWENPIQNRLNFEKIIGSIPDSVELIVLPEMFTSGFTMSPENVAETMQGETVNWLKNIASTKNVAIVGSLVIVENTNYYNRLLFIHPSGEINYYDKRHTFTLAGEDKVYTAGTQKLLVEYRGWKICPLICYDLRFPVWARNVENYDLLIYVANWPKPRIGAWDALLKARAIENMSYTIGVNRIGLDANSYEYPGHSVFLDCLGKDMCALKANEAWVSSITLNKTYQEKLRTRLQFLNDKDQFTLM